MNAFQSPQQYPPPERPPRRRSSRVAAPVRRRRFQGAPAGNVYRRQGIELGLRLGVNAIAIALTVGGLWRLVPFYWSRSVALEQIESEVSGLETRVNALQTEFRDHFDPAGGARTTHETTGRLGPNQRYLILQAPAAGSESPN